MENVLCTRTHTLPHPLSQPYTYTQRHGHKRHPCHTSNISIFPNILCTLYTFGRQQHHHQVKRIADTELLSSNFSWFLPDSHSFEHEYLLNHKIIIELLNNRWKFHIAHWCNAMQILYDSHFYVCHIWYMICTNGNAHWALTTFCSSKRRANKIHEISCNWSNYNSDCVILHSSNSILQYNKKAPTRMCGSVFHCFCTTQGVNRVTSRTPYTTESQSKQKSIRMIFKCDA